MEISVPEFTRDNDRGQVGIETLIVFIAMILVAAIAASVLINTAGFLQNQASETSQDSEDQVSNQVLIISSVGEVVNTGEEDQFLEITLDRDDTDGDELQVTDGEAVLDEFADNNVDLEVITEADGSVIWTAEDDGTDGLEFSDTDSLDAAGGVEIRFEDPDSEEIVDTIELETTANGEDTTNLTLIEGETDNAIGEVSMTVMQSPGANEIDLAGASIEYIGPDGQQLLSYSDDPVIGEFGVDGTQDPDETAPVLTQREDRYTVSIELAENEDALRLLDEGEDATVRINTQAGSEAVTILNVPQSISSYDDGDAVEL